MAKQKTTRNEKFNGYELAEDTYASIASTNVSLLKKITGNTYKNIQLLDTANYIKVTGKEIVEDALNNHTLEDLGYEANLNHYEGSAIDTENNFYIFGAPYRMVLDNRQQYSNCGIDSTLNNLVMAGVKTINDQNKTEADFVKEIWTKGYCDDDGTIGVFDIEDGGSKPDDYKAIFAKYGIDSKAYYTEQFFKDEDEYGHQLSPNGVVLEAKQWEDENLKELGRKVKQGCGVVIGVCSDILWMEQNSETGERDIDHAVSILGVVYDKENPEDTDTPVGFIIHDTGAWMTRFITTEELKEAGLYDEVGVRAVADGDDNLEYNPNLYGKDNPGLFLTVTTEPIKDSTNNLDVTGDNNDNVITGNSGDNVLKGLKGDDTIRGLAGDDSIYGGSGKDSLYGGDGNDFLYGEAGNDNIYGGSGIDIIYGGSGNDFIYGATSSDRLFGEAGNDYIEGGQGEDIIDAGAGNDTILGGVGNDRIETGAGNDTVLFEDKNHGIDYIYSSKGSVTLKYDETADCLIDDLYFDIDFEDNKYDLEIAYEEPVDEDLTPDNGIIISGIYDTKKNKAINASIIDSDGETYKIGISNKAKAAVLDKSTKGAHADINNILFSLNQQGGSTVTTSTKDDIVFFTGASEKIVIPIERTADAEAYINEQYNTNRKDSITYVGGKDRYYSHSGDTTYKVNFDKNSNLSIYDNVDLLKVEQTKLVAHGLQYVPETTEVNVAASSNDAIVFTASLDDLSFLFDVTRNGLATENTELYTIYKDNDTATANTIKAIAGAQLPDGAETTGTVMMVSFFGEGEEIGSDDMYGNGRIEKFYTTANRSVVEYESFAANLNSIQEAVTAWFEGYAGEYATAFEVIENDTANAAGLIACYMAPNVMPA